MNENMILGNENMALGQLFFTGHEYMSLLYWYTAVSTKVVLDRTAKT